MERRALAASIAAPEHLQRLKTLPELNGLQVHWKNVALVP